MKEDKCNNEALLRKEASSFSPIHWSWDDSERQLSLYFEVYGLTAKQGGARGLFTIAPCETELTVEQIEQGIRTIQSHGLIGLPVKSVTKQEFFGEGERVENEGHSGLRTEKKEAARSNSDGKPRRVIIFDGWTIDEGGETVRRDEIEGDFLGWTECNKSNYDPGPYAIVEQDNGYVRVESFSKVFFPDKIKEGRKNNE